VLSLLIGRMRQSAPHPGAKLEVQEGRAHLSWDHPNQETATALWANSLGTTDFIFAGTVLEQLAQVAGAGGGLTEREFNAILSLVRAVAPADSVEALLATQMVAVHTAMLAAARRLAHAEGVEHQDSASTAMNKLARTFAAQVDALKRYRTKGEQTITVQHVTVHDGGQAIVGDVQHAPRGSLEKERQSHELAAPDAHGSTLLGNLQTNGQSLPGAGSEGPTRVPVSRGSSGRTQRESQRRLSARTLQQRGQRSTPRRGSPAS
jgi:hypothetical protein